MSSHGEQAAVGLGVAVAILIPAMIGDGDRSLRQRLQIAGAQGHHPLRVRLVGFAIDHQLVSALNIEAEIVLRFLIVEDHIAADIHFDIDRDKAGFDVQLMAGVGLVVGTVNRPGADLADINKSLHIRRRDHHLPVSILTQRGGIIFLVGAGDHQPMAWHHGRQRAAQP